MGDGIDLGRCCGCNARLGVRNVVMLEKKSPIPGRGWGCLICDLPADGAIAAVCDHCQRACADRGIDEVLRFACRGYPGTDGRIEYSELQGRHEHDLSRHVAG